MTVHDAIPKRKRLMSVQFSRVFLRKMNDCKNRLIGGFTLPLHSRKMNDTTLYPLKKVINRSGGFQIVEWLYSCPDRERLISPDVLLWPAKSVSRIAGFGGFFATFWRGRKMNDCPRRGYHCGLVGLFSHCYLIHNAVVSDPQNPNCPGMGEAVLLSQQCRCF